MWKYLSENVEIITNSLDLVSFILVTTEVFNYLEMPTALVFVVSLAFSSMIIWAGLYGVAMGVMDVYFPSSVFSLLAVAVVGPISGYIMLRILFRILSNATEIWQIARRFMFLLGIFLFFISRVLALVVAVYR